MVDLLISVILEALFEKYSVQGNQEWIIELDSSTEGMVFNAFGGEGEGGFCIAKHKSDAVLLNSQS